jgi:hypothetical protein
MKQRWERNLNHNQNQDPILGKGNRKATRVTKKIKTETVIVIMVAMVVVKADLREKEEIRNRTNKR